MRPGPSVCSGGKFKNPREAGARGHRGIAEYCDELNSYGYSDLCQKIYPVQYLSVRPAHRLCSEIFVVWSAMENLPGSANMI